MIDWQLLLEFLKIILSWPPLAALFGMILFFSFKNDVSALIGRIKAGRFLGAEFDISQKSLTERDPKPAPLAIESDDKPRSSAGDGFDGDQTLLAERAAARIWEYRFLNYFLAPHTQIALDWLISTPGPMSAYAFDSHWSSLISKAEERRAIVEALESHNLVDITGGTLRVTDKGREYAAWSGRPANPLSAPPPTGSIQI